MPSTYKAVRETLLSQINAGEFRPGEKIASLRTIAKGANTTTYTVFRALNQLVQEGVLRNVAGQGYYVSESSSASGTQAGTIGLLANITSRDNPRMYPELDVVQRRLMQQGCPILLIPAITEKIPFKLLPMESVAAHRLDALFVIGFQNHVQLLPRLAEFQKNIIVLDTDVSDLKIDCVVTDNAGSASRMIRHLVQQGARRIAFCGGPFPPPERALRADVYDPCSRERYDAWRSAMHAAGLSPDENLVFLDPSSRSFDRSFQALSGILRSNDGPDAIIAEGPIKLLEALAKAGHPQGTMPIAGWVTKEDVRDKLPAGLTVAAVCDLEQVGIRGLDVLSRRLAQPSAPVMRVLVEPKIVFAEK